MVQYGRVGTSFANGRSDVVVAQMSFIRPHTVRQGLQSSAISHTQAHLLTLGRLWHPPDYGNNRFKKIGHRQVIHVEMIGVRRVSRVCLTARDVVVFLFSEDLSRYYCAWRAKGCIRGTCASFYGPSYYIPAHH